MIRRSLALALAPWLLPLAAGAQEIKAPFGLQPKGDGSGVNVTATGTTTARTAAARAADRIIIKDYGAKLDGSDDTAAFSSARGALASDGAVDVPAGQFVVNTAPTAGPATPILWRLTGNKFGSGSTPVTAIGTDTVETVVNGGKYFGQGSTLPDGNPVLRIDQSVTHAGGTAGNVINALQVNQTIPSLASGSLANYGWASSVVLRSSAAGSGQHVASAALAARPSTALSDGKGPRATLWADYKEANDATGQAANLAGSLVIGEWDMYANAGDPSSQRIGHHMVFSRQNSSGTAARFGKGSVLATNDALPASSQSYLGKGYSVEMPFDTAAFDASAGTSLSNAPAFKMAETQTFAGEATGTYNFRYITGLWQWRNGASETYRLDGAGNTTQPGSATVTGGVVAPSIKSATTNSGVLTGAFIRTADPTTTDIPAGQCADWNNTTAATFKHVCNFGGTLRSVAMN